MSHTKEQQERATPTAGQEVPLRRAPGVHRLLVTGPENRLQAFTVLAGMLVNPMDRRGQTVFYTVMDEGLEAAIELARRSQLTVQQRAEQAPWWPVVVRGLAEPWAAEPKQTTTTKET